MLFYWNMEPLKVVLMGNTTFYRLNSALSTRGSGEKILIIIIIIIIIIIPNHKNGYESVKRRVKGQLGIYTFLVCQCDLQTIGCIRLVPVPSD